MAFVDVHYELARAFPCFIFTLSFRFLCIPSILDVVARFSLRKANRRFSARNVESIFDK